MFKILWARWFCKYYDKDRYGFNESLSGRYGECQLNPLTCCVGIKCKGCPLRGDK